MEEETPTGSGFRMIVVKLADNKVQELSDLNIMTIHKQLHQRIREYICSAPSVDLPLFNSCSKAAPYGVVFACVNRDAIDWLEATIETAPFAGRGLAVAPESVVPARKDVLVSVFVPSDFVRTLDATTTLVIFHILAKNNKMWFVTSDWRYKTSRQPSDGVSIWFSVPPSDVPKLIERNARLHFLFYTVKVEFNQL